MSMPETKAYKDKYKQSNKMQKSCKVYAWDVTCYKLQQKMFIQVQQVNFHNHWSLFYKDVHQCGITTSVMNGATGAQGTWSFCIAPLTGGGLGSLSLGGSSLRAEGGILGGPAEDSWTGSNFGGSSLSLWSTSTNCWKSAKVVCFLKLPSSASPCLSFFLVLLPVTISAPSLIRGTLPGELTILPGPIVGVLLVMFSSWLSCPGSVSCTTRCGDHPNILMSCHMTASVMRVPAGMSKQVLVYYYIILLFIKVHHLQLHTIGYKTNPCIAQMSRSKISVQCCGKSLGSSLGG